MNSGDLRKMKLATVGMGNWAGRVLDLLLAQHDAGDAGFELAAVCEPKLGAFPARLEQVRQRGIVAFERYDDLLSAKGIEAVVLPVPIHLHRPMTQRALLAGKPVMVEKPVAGCVQDVDAMIAARDAAKLQVLVSFQDTYDPALLDLKRAILGGEIGAIRSASLVGCWPRDESYYARTTWAGKIRHHDTWVLDSPVSNAFAHYLHLAMFLLGPDEHAWAIPQSVEAELYRVYPIENYDTASLRMTTGGVTMLVFLTHACEQIVGPHITLVGERGTIDIDLSTRVATLRSGQNERRAELHREPRELVVPSFVRHLNGLPVPAAISTLEAARCHVIASNGASQAASVQPLGPNVYDIRRSDDEIARVIPGIEQLFMRCAAAGQMIYESGLADWSVGSRLLRLDGYNRFTGCPKLGSAVHDLSNLKLRRADTVYLPTNQTLSRDGI